MTQIYFKEAINMQPCNNFKVFWSASLNYVNENWQLNVFCRTVIFAMPCFSRTASFSAASHFFRHSSCCDTNLINSRKGKELKGITYDEERRNATKNKSQHKPPSIPSARTDAERTISSKGPTSVATDIVDSFRSLKFVMLKKIQRKNCSRRNHLQDSAILFVFSLHSFQTRVSQSDHVFYTAHMFFGNTAGQRSQAQSLKPSYQGHQGCLPFVRINRLGRALNKNGKGFSKISNPTERNGAYHLHVDFPQLFSADERPETGKFSKWYGNFRRSVPNGKSGEGTPQFPNGISGKLPYHLTSNRNFRIFSPNGKHPSIKNILPGNQRHKNFTILLGPVQTPNFSWAELRIWTDPD